MAENNGMKSISQLDDMHFLVEDYQRGYKWTPTEVKQLLDDINEFNGDGFYCLQPVVVKRHAETDKIELIDGQQRITTLYLILSYLGKTAFFIDYRTRQSSACFLKDINSINEENNWEAYLSKQENFKNDNIDNYHFFNAYKKIQNWFIGKGESFKYNFFTKISNQVKIIWYEVPNNENSKQESIKIFTRINSGKIPLTNGELIKALFLINVDKGDSKELLQLKQTEIAQQWDNIEYALQNDEFWYFLSNEKPPATRIDLIFSLIVSIKEKQNNNSNNIIFNFNKEDKLYIFLVYDSLLTNSNSYKENLIETEWDEVKSIFFTLQEWFENKKLYHFIGFLIWKKEKIIDMLIWKKGSKNNTEFATTIKAKTTFNLNQNQSIETYLNSINYENLGLIKEVLVLFNILTLLKVDQSTNFSFNKFKDENWDIEHIHAQQSKNINDKNDWITWKNETVSELKKIIFLEINATKRDILIKKFDSVKNETITRIEFDDLFTNTVNFYNQLDENYNEINALSNLALLDARTNRSYGNAIFSVKRKKIIEQDETGVFIPICTKNVFLKYYSKDLSQMFLWTSNDRKDYFNKIKETLENHQNA